MALDLIGKRLGNYQIEQPLGRGGMALVYKALDTTLKRPAAIKVMAPDLTDEERYHERFEHEAQSIAALDHPNIVPVYYFGKSRSLYYLAMKFIEGETLETLIKRYATDGEFLPTADILRVVEGVASALDYAHSKGVIHRDVKPSNIMLDSNGHPYLTDFGLALNVHHGSMGEIFGTAHYIAPEQATSSSSAVPQSDLYSLGVILYELFTGVVPFDDPSPMAIALHHITKTPAAPRALNPQLAPAVEQVILKALEKQPEARYQSGAKLVSALRSALRGTPKSDQAKTPALPPLPPGMKSPPQRQISKRPVASEVQTLLEQRAKAKTPTPPVNTPPGQPVARPKGTREVKRVSVSQSGSRGLRRVLLLLLIIVIGGAGVLLTQQTNTVIPLANASDVTSPPPEWQPVRFLYNTQSFWWVNEGETPISVMPIRFTRADDSAQFQGSRWARIYSRVEERSCVRLNAFDAEERMLRPEDCIRINADITSSPNEMFWTGSGQFYIYWNEERMAVCDIAAGECTASLPTQ